MIKEKINQLGLILNPKKQEGKRKIENLVVFIVLLVITIIVINMILSDDKKKNDLENNFLENDVILANNKDNINSQNYSKDEFEEKLEAILSKIDGVGVAKVMITYSQTNKTVAMYNEDLSTTDTEENASRKWN